MTIDIDNFTYDVIDNKLKINVDLILDNLIKKEDEDEIIDVNDLFLEKEEEKELNVPVYNDEKAEDNKIVEESLFESLDSSNETYSTYSVCIINEQDSIDTIMEKYKVSRKDLE